VRTTARFTETSRMPPPPYRSSLAAGAARFAVVGGVQRGDEGFLRDLDPADHLHPALALLLLLQQLALAGDVTAVALGEHVLADRPDVLPGDDARPDRRLDRDLELLPRDVLAQLLRHRHPVVV